MRLTVEKTTWSFQAKGPRIIPLKGVMLIEHPAVKILDHKDETAFWGIYVKPAGEKMLPVVTGIDKYLETTTGSDPKRQTMIERHSEGFRFENLGLGFKPSLRQRHRYFEVLQFLETGEVSNQDILLGMGWC